MSENILPRPDPLYKRVFQPGITDPVWPVDPPQDVDQEIYKSRYAGQLERQRFLFIISGDVNSSSRMELEEILIQLSEFAATEMAKPPSITGRRPYDASVTNRRLTISVGFGATLFTSSSGDDRFGIVGKKPNWLKVMQATEGDSESFNPSMHASDLLVLVACDDIYVNEYIAGRLYYGGVHKGIRIKQVDRGYARPDSREPSGFEDGITNPKDSLPVSDLHELVYVQKKDQEPDWCINGTYLGYRKIQHRLGYLFSSSVTEQEQVYGVSKETGQRLSTLRRDAHVAKANPHRVEPDLFYRKDESRKFLRRPYFYDDGIADGNLELRGLLHLGFARNLMYQYEWPIHMWQMNKDFPSPNSGIDALYRIAGASNVGGGYYFFPPAAEAGKHLGSLLLE